eukprot:TRINITY_DN5891_c0_g1_i2.p1 TRINITY_DN5891_c0_g1~~TRINITY_DN5891_c0_g1_i2.p1  ORF type:complete len:260 (+),score=24.86 TRINITY_DN5891_c0_g1_i2:92-871(+)
MRARCGPGRGSGGGANSPTNSRVSTVSGGKGIGGVDELPALQGSRAGFWPSRLGLVVPSLGATSQAPVEPVGACHCWGEALGLPECSVSARGCGSDRPTTRDRGSRPCTHDGKRPCTQDGGRRRTPTLGEQLWQGLGLDNLRPSTRDAARTPQTGGTDNRMQSLDGTRPSTREGFRLQQMINGVGSQQSARGTPATAPSDELTARRCRGTLPELRCQDWVVKQVRRKRSKHQISKSPCKTPSVLSHDDVEELFASELLD